MVNFLEGIHPSIYEFLYNPPYVPMDLIPSVPATGTTPEIPKHYEPKAIINWSEEDKILLELGSKGRRLLIMAIPHDIFKNIDHCYLSRDIWAKLERHIEGGKKTLKNNRAFCIDEYHTFKAKEGESLSDTYSRFNTLISNYRRYGVIRSTEDNNSLFLNSLGPEWMHLTMSMKATLDLEAWTLADLFGSLKSQELQVMQLRRSYGGPLALVVGEGSERKIKEKKEEKEKKNKKKVLIADSDESSEDEPSMKELVKALALMTKEYQRGGDRREYRSSERKSYRDGITDESSKEDAHNGLFALEDSDTEDELFCGTARIDTEASDPETSKLKEKLSLYENEVNLLTEEKSRFFKMFTEAQNKFVNLEKSSKDKMAKVEKDLQDKIRKFQDAQNVFKKIRVNMGRRGLEFSKSENECSSSPQVIETDIVAHDSLRQELVNTPITTICNTPLKRKREA
ncbi:hypothetical protein OSB04_016648 [Centaurea solstitialis]|uniref:Uncharacterized protein n=1 Tax=Centaurea solstitialis TaxID=347529 RepID=A0AA38T915_9ASTR|nr:hypothetical protein OSB04_016648 [Centaurea solstitialis]